MIVLNTLLALVGPPPKFSAQKEHELVNPVINYIEGSLTPPSFRYRVNYIMLDRC